MKTKNGLIGKWKTASPKSFCVQAAPGPAGGDSSAPPDHLWILGEGERGEKRKDGERGKRTGAKGKEGCKGENRKRESGEERVMGYRRENGGKEREIAPILISKSRRLW